MLKDFIGNVGYKKIPHTGTVYEINCAGILRETVSNAELEPSLVSGEWIIPPNTTNEWFDGLSIAVILGVTYRNCILPIHLLKELTVIYKDGNKANHRLTNFIWGSPVGKLNHRLFPGYCYIPGFSRYLINTNGEVLSVAHGGHLSPYVNEDGYLMYGVQPDVGKRTIVGMHRLLMLAFTPYTEKVDSLDVNHLDTVKDNNNLTNLEWASRQRNSTHAHANGLSNSKAVLVRDINTGDVKRYYSIEETARVLNIDGETTRLRLMKGSHLVYNGCYQFKFEEDATPWENNEMVTHVNLSRRVQIESIKTGNILIKNSVKEAAEFFNVTPGALSYHLRKSEHGSVLGEYLVKYESPHIPK